MKEYTYLSNELNLSDSTRLDSTRLDSTHTPSTLCLAYRYGTSSRRRGSVHDGECYMELHGLDWVIQYCMTEERLVLVVLVDFRKSTLFSKD
jgi:hypothetical protein